MQNFKILVVDKIGWVATHTCIEHKQCTGNFLKSMYTSSPIKITVELSCINTCTSCYHYPCQQCNQNPKNLNFLSEKQNEIALMIILNHVNEFKQTVKTDFHSNLVHIKCWL